jgi:hypothetical protein
MAPFRFGASMSPMIACLTGTSASAKIANGAAHLSMEER